MTFRQRIANIIAQFLLERPARSTALSAYPERLQQAGAEIERRFLALGTTPAAKAVQTLRHITTIERWSQNRVRAFLGEKIDPTDDSNSYALPLRDPAGVLADFKQTRVESVALARRLAQHKPTAPTVTHNDFGPLTPGGWLQYMVGHANAEARRRIK